MCFANGKSTLPTHCGYPFIMSKSSQPTISIATCGLSTLDESLLRVTLTKGQALFDKPWVLDSGEIHAECAVAIVDIDNAEGQRLWQTLDDDHKPVKVAYTDYPENVTGSPFALSKPLWAGELMIVMQRVLARLNESVASAPPARPSLPACALSTVQSQTAAAVESGDDDAAPVNLAPGLSLRDRFKLKRWPDFKKFKYTTRHVKIAVLISKQSQDIDTMARIGSLPVAETMAFINRCHELGYLEVERAAPPPPSVVAASQADKAKKAKVGFFQRIRSRLGL